MIYGIDAHLLLREQPTGVPRYALELLTEMMRVPLRDGERVVLYGHRAKPETLSLPDGWTWKVVPWLLKRGWTHGGLSKEMILHPPDVLFVPGHELPSFSRKRTRFVTTVHDVAFRRLAKIYPSEGRRRQEWAIRLAVKRSRQLIAVSHATKNDLLELYGVPSERVTVIHEAVRPEMFRCDAVRGDYLLSIGRVEKKKNIATLIEAFDVFKSKTGSATKLVLAGSPGFGSEEILGKIEASPFKNDIDLLGFVPDDEMIRLLCGARAYLFPSWYEGFGIPALEAMAADVPLVASDIPALREVADDAAMFAPPEDPRVWAEAMERVTSDSAYAATLVTKGRARLQKFSWKKAAEETWAVLRSVAYEKVD